jgi:NADH kinase
VVATFGGDGTILRASSFFSSTPYVPPVLAFSMGTLGFLGEWRFEDHKRAFREIYMSGAPSLNTPTLTLANDTSAIRTVDSNEPPTKRGTGWDELRGMRLGSTRGARVLLRHRLKVGMSEGSGSCSPSLRSGTQHAMNEVLLHRGSDPHLVHIHVTVNGRFLTEVVADGMLVSTPTGSTAYSLSAGGSIIHPLVPSLLLTPICPRSLSFRPLVLPANASVVLRLSDKNRGRHIECSMDGIKSAEGVTAGTELRVTGEAIMKGHDGWTGGVPCLMKSNEQGGDDGWVGGLNGLLKFNFPFGEED